VFHVGSANDGTNTEDRLHAQTTSVRLARMSLSAIEPAARGAKPLCRPSILSANVVVSGFISLSQIASNEKSRRR
jgi:hypothetical protein